MPFTGYLEIDDIPGESQRAHREGRIEGFGLARAFARHDHGPDQPN
jgi:hypothetical protein